MRKIILILLALLLIGVPAWAATQYRYVKSSAASNGIGTEASPWKLLSDINWTRGSELTTNGDFATNDTTGWTLNASAAAAPVSAATGALAWPAVHDDYAEVKQLSKCTVGKTYAYSFDVVSKTDATTTITIQAGRGFIYNTGINLLDLGTHTGTVVATHTDGFACSVRTNGAITIDNISLIEVTTNNIQDVIDAGDTAVIALYGGDEWTAALTVGYAGTSESARVVIDGNLSEWGDGTKAFIDLSHEYLAAAWTACNGTDCPSGVYYATITANNLAYFFLNTKDATGLMRLKGGRITAATKASPVELTFAEAHGLSTGDQIVIADVAGMTQLNGNTYTVTYVSSTKVTLGVDGTGYGVYSTSPRSGLAVGAADNCWADATDGYTKVYFRPASGTPGDANNRTYVPAVYAPITANAKSYVTFKNLKVTGGSSIAIKMDGAYGIAQKNEVSFSSIGIGVIGNGADYNVIGGSAGNGNEITNCFGAGGIYHLGYASTAAYTTISYNLLHDGMNNNFLGGDQNAIGVNCVGGGSGVVVEYNEVYNWGPPDSENILFDSSIAVYDSPSTIVRFNNVHDNYSGCIYVQTGSDNSSVIGNLCLGNGRATGTWSDTQGEKGDLYLATSTGLKVYNNTCLGNLNTSGNLQDSSLYLKGTEAGSYTWEIKNNIFGQPTTAYTFGATDGDTWDGSLITDNIFVGTGNNFYYGGAAHDYAAFATAFSLPASNLNTDPLVAADGSLAAGSPAILAGTRADTISFTGTQEDYFGNEYFFAPYDRLNIGADQQYSDADLRPTAGGILWRNGTR